MEGEVNYKIIIFNKQQMETTMPTGVLTEEQGGGEKETETVTARGLIAVIAPTARSTRGRTNRNSPTDTGNWDGAHHPGKSHAQVRYSCPCECLPSTLVLVGVLW